MIRRPVMFKKLLEWLRLDPVTQRELREIEARDPGCPPAVRMRVL